MMTVTPMRLPEVCLIAPRIFRDPRGFFLATWQDAAFREQVSDVSFVQDNYSRSSFGTLRGLHFQGEHTQGKLVQCSAGRIWDIAVDVRRSSPSFGQWVASELSDENHHMLWVPAGFAHGFLVLSATADVRYKVTDVYDPGSERTLMWNDPALSITWPIPDGVTPILSEKDAVGMPLSLLDALP
jgi:dTDP-4-dehydrorhamnose 3,5-epimerase